MSLKLNSLDDESKGTVVRMDDFIMRKRKYDYQTDPIVQRMRDTNSKIFGKKEKESLLNDALKDFEKELEEDEVQVLKTGIRIEYAVYCRQLIETHTFLPRIKLLDLISNLKYAIAKKDEDDMTSIYVSDEFMKLTLEEAEKELEYVRNFVMDKIYSIGKEKYYLLSWAVSAKSKEAFEKETSELAEKYKNL